MDWVLPLWTNNLHLKKGGKTEDSKSPPEKSTKKWNVDIVINSPNKHYTCIRIFLKDHTRSP